MDSLTLEDLLKTRLTSLIIAGAMAASVTGCALAAPVATLKDYDPSDGVGVNVGEVEVRNLLLIAEKPDTPYNVVFSAVNTSGKEQTVNFTFVTADGKEVSAEFTVPTGNTRFGNIKDKYDIEVVELGKQEIGSTVETYVQSGKSDNVSVETPVLDDTLVEYKDYVITAEEAAELPKD